MKKEVISFMKFFLCLAMVLSFLTCTQKEAVKIGLLMDNFKKARWVKDKNYFVEQANSMNAEVIVEEAGEKEDVQLRKAIEMLNMDIDVLVVVPVNVNTAAAIVREAHKRDVKVIAYDRLIKNSDLDLYISFDNVKVGELMAAYVVEKKPSGNYVILGGDKFDQNAVWLKEGVMKILKPHISEGRIDIIYDVFVNEWSGDNAAYHIGKVLSFTDKRVDAILSFYDGMSDGVIPVLKKHGLSGEVVLTGQDADLYACHHILEGEQDMTIYKSLKNLANAAARAAYSIATGKKPEGINSSVENGRTNVPAILLEPQVVDKKNMREVLVQDGFYTEEQLFDR